MNEAYLALAFGLGVGCCAILSIPVRSKIAVWESSADLIDRVGHFLTWWTSTHMRAHASALAAAKEARDLWVERAQEDRENSTILRLTD
jgi:hypothetical protein